MFDTKESILLVDTGFAAIPIYNYLLTLDRPIWVIGNRASDEIAIAAGDYWINENYSDAPSLHSALKEKKITRVVPGCTDISISACSQLQTENIDDLTTLTHLHDKAAFRKLCRELNIPSPIEVAASDFPITGTFICKPVDAFSGRGISILDGRDLGAVSEATKTAIKASRTHAVIFERYVEGDLYSFSCFLENQSILQHFIVREGSSTNPFVVDTSFVCHNTPDELVKILYESIERIARHLKLRNGLIHTQFILHNGEPYIIEITRRCPGDLYSLLIEESCGYAYAAKYASYFVSRQVNASIEFKKLIIRHTVQRVGRFSHHGINLRYPCPLKAFYTVPRAASTDAPQRTAVAFFEYENERQRDHAYGSFLQMNVYDAQS